MQYRNAWFMLPLVAACGQSPVSFGVPSGYQDPSAASTTSTTGSPDGGTSASDGLPCDVANLLSTRCDSCHSNPPVGGAPMSLVTYADLMKPTPTDPSQTNAQMSVTRMQSATAPMPPGTHLASTEIAVLANWVAAGAPAGSCQPSVPDAGVVTPPGMDAGVVASGGGSGLPCDVATLLQNSCQTCHSNPPVGGAPMSLMTYADLLRPAPTDPTQTNAQMSLTRMQSTTSPMPPGSPLPAADVAVLANWIASGLPQGSCQSSAPDGGSGIPNTPAQCTSNTYSTAEEGSTMRPGEACIACHSSGEGPQFAIAGTLYPTVHEPNDCMGTSSAQVVITDAAGHSVTLTPNSAGNFYSTAGLQFPIRASVTANGQTRAMATPQYSGDCNSCHTQNGSNGAPGRVIVP